MGGHVQEGLPFSGSTPVSAHHSAEAARAAAATRATKTRHYLALLERAGEAGLSDHEAMPMLGVPMSSITSIRNGLGVLVTPAARVGCSPFGRKVTCWRVATAEEQRAARERAARQQVLGGNE